MRGRICDLSGGLIMSDKVMLWRWVSGSVVSGPTTSPTAEQRGRTPTQCNPYRSGPENY